MTKIRYRATMPDGTFAFRNSPTRRVYTAAVARQVSGGSWVAISFARTAELAAREAATQARAYRRTINGITLPEATFVVVPVEAIP